MPDSLRSRTPLEVRHLFDLIRSRRADPIYRLMGALVHEGDAVADIGANRGWYTGRLAELVGPSGHVHVFEPNPLHWPPLHAIAGARSTLTIYPLALSDHAGTEGLHIPLREGEAMDAWARLSLPASSISLAHDCIPVRVERLDAILPTVGPGLTFVKCDVEGHEPAVIRGAEATLRRSRPILIVEIEQRHQDTDIRQTFRQLTSLGYTGYSLSPHGLRPLEEFDVRREQLAFLEDAAPYSMPPDGYINNFLFVSAKDRDKVEVLRKLPFKAIGSVERVDSHLG